MKKIIIFIFLMLNLSGYSQNKIIVVRTGNISSSTGSQSYADSKIFKGTPPTITYNPCVQSQNFGCTPIYYVNGGTILASNYINSSSSSYKTAQIHDLNPNDFPLTLHSVGKFFLKSYSGTDSQICYNSQIEEDYNVLSYEYGAQRQVNGCSVGGITVYSPNILIKPNAPFGVCENITQTGCSKYYYSKTGTSWVELPIQSGSKTLNFVVKNIPDLGQSYSGNLFIKGDFTIDNLYDNNTVLPAVSLPSNIITYSIVPCPPKLDPNILPNPKGETCYDKKDGEVTFTFDRPLETDERFLFTFNPIGAPTAITSAYSDNTNMVEKISSLEYKLIKITPRTYNFKYQTQFNNDTPSSPVVGPDFTIIQKAALKFTATPTQPSCSIGNGSVTIVANGGTAPYYYILDNAVENINGQVVPKKILITNPIQLPSGNHNIKVVDWNECIQTQE
jgi:hypothetical protein